MMSTSVSINIAVEFPIQYFWSLTVEWSTSEVTVCPETLIVVQGVLCVYCKVTVCPETLIVVQGVLCVYCINNI